MYVCVAGGWGVWERVEEVGGGGGGVCILSLSVCVISDEHKR